MAAAALSVWRLHAWHCLRVWLEVCAALHPGRLMNVSRCGCRITHSHSDDDGDDDDNSIGALGLTLANAYPEETSRVAGWS